MGGCTVTVRHPFGAGRARGLRPVVAGCPRDRRPPHRRPARDDRRPGHPGEQAQHEADPLRREVDELVGRWLSVPEVAEVLGADITRVRSLLDDGALLAVRRGRPRVLSVPAALAEPEPLPGLAGTLTLLGDAGYDELESLRWLFSPQATLDGGTPVERMRARPAGRDPPAGPGARLLTRPRLLAQAGATLALTPAPIVVAATAARRGPGTRTRRRSTGYPSRRTRSRISP